MTSSIGSSNAPACRACARASAQEALDAAIEGLRSSTRPSTYSRSRPELSEVEVIAGRSGSIAGTGAAVAGLCETNAPNGMSEASMASGRNLCMEQPPPETRIPPQYGGARRRALKNGPERAPEECLESECGCLEGSGARSSAFEVDEAERPRHGFDSARSGGYNRHRRYKPIICAAVINAYGARVGRDGALHDQLAARIGARRCVPMAHRARRARLRHAASTNEVRRYRGR